MRRVLLIVVTLIVYGSLYPWNFRTLHLAVSPLWILLHSWPTGLSRYLIWDVAVNVTLYIPLGLFAFLSISDRAPGVLRIAVPLLVGLVLSAAIEMLQLFVPARDCSMSDVLSNFTGTAVGAGLGALYHAKLQHVVTGRTATRLLHPSGALMLLCCWLGYQVFPLFPGWGRSRLHAKLAALGPLGAISPVDTLLVLAEWLAVACLLEGVLEKRTSRLLVLLLLVLPLRLLIVSRTLAWSDIAGAMLACAIWISTPRLPVRRATPVLLAVALVLAELLPFHLAPPGKFNWVPFRSLFQTAWQSGFVVLFRKSFWYGSVIWLWRGVGFGLLLPAVVTAMVLFALEWVQIYLPGRIPEISDAVLAALMGVLLALLDPPAKAIAKDRTHA